MLRKIKSMFNKLSKIQKVILGLLIGYCIYKCVLVAEHFFNEEDEVKVEDKKIPAKTAGMGEDTSCTRSGPNPNRRRPPTPPCALPDAI